MVDFQLASGKAKRLMCIRLVRAGGSPACYPVFPALTVVFQCTLHRIIVTWNCAAVTQCACYWLLV